MNRLGTTLLVAGALAGAASAASADLLLTKDGATIETAGPWKVDGRRVLFTQPNGQLSSINAAEVDLDASALATARAAEAAAAAEEAPAPAPSAPILTLNEDDLPKETPEGEGDVAETKSETETAPGSPLQVVSWEQQQLQNDEGVQIFGVVKNNSRNLLTAVSVTATLYGEEGGMLANGDAQLNRTSIAANETANFRVEFPGLPDFAAVKFNASARGFESSGVPLPADQESGEPIEPPAEAEEVRAPSDAERERAAERAYNENMKATGNEPQAAPEPEPEPPPVESGELDEPTEPADTDDPPPARV